MMGPPQGYVQTMFSTPRSERDGKFHHIHYSRVAVSMCGCRKEDAIEVSIREGQGGYWAWWDEQRQKFSLIWPNRVQLKVCFLYGMQAAIDVGDGIDVEVEVVPVGEE